MSSAALREAMPASERTFWMRVPSGGSPVRAVARLRGGISEDLRPGAAGALAGRPGGLLAVEGREPLRGGRGPVELRSAGRRLVAGREAPDVVEAWMVSDDPA